LARGCQAGFVVKKSVGRETLRRFCVQARWKGIAMNHAMRSLLVLAATVAAVLAITAAPSSAGVSPDQLRQAGWTCVVPLADPTRLICAPPGLGLPPLPNTPGFADRAPSYQLLVFAAATGELIGIQHLLRPDVYFSGTPKCPQQPGGEYAYIMRNDTWSCFRAK